MLLTFVFNHNIDSVVVPVDGDLLFSWPLLCVIDKAGKLVFLVADWTVALVIWRVCSSPYEYSGKTG